MPTTVTVKIPPAFYDDHVARDLPAGVETHRTKKVITVDLTAEELAELVSDARHYAQGGEEYWQDHRGLVISARATLKVLAQVTPPAPDPEPFAAQPLPEQVRLAKLEAKAIKAWQQGGEEGPRPATPNLEVIEARSAQRTAARKGTGAAPVSTSREEPASSGETPRRNLRPIAAGTTLPSGNLAPGALAQAVADHVTGNAGSDHSVGEVAKALGGKSAGAVRNALDRMVANGTATLTSEKPRRYQAAAAAASGAA